MYIDTIRKWFFLIVSLSAGAEYTLNTAVTFEKSLFSSFKSRTFSIVTEYIYSWSSAGIVSTSTG